MIGNWRGVRVAITGHTGFKGGWLAYMLHSLGARVYGYALEPATTPNLFDLLRLGDLIESRIGDIRDAAALNSFFADAHPEVVFHFAAQSLVRAGYDRPLETFDVNVRGTAMCLEAALSHRVPITIVATSDKCYRNDGSISRAFLETDPLGGEDPYSASKGAAEITIEGYRRSFFTPMGLQVASVRAGNVIGGGDWSPDRLFTDLVRATFETRPLLLRYPQSVRPWQHVLDALSGYLHIALASRKGLNVGEPWNVGPAPDQAATVAQVVEMFGLAAGRSPIVEQGSNDQKPEAMVLRLDPSKIRAQLRWSPAFTTQAAIVETCKWYADFYSGRSIREITDRQIDAVVTHASST